MSEQLGVSYVGRAAWKQLVNSVSMVEFVSAVLAGGAAVTYLLGTALRNSTTGLMAKYTNAGVITDEAVGTGDGSTTTFDLAHANVIAASVKARVAGVLRHATISAGTGTLGVDQLVFEVAPTNAAAITVDYDWYDSAYGATGACILAEDAATTVAGGNVTVNGLFKGSVKSSLVLDSAGNPVDQYFKDKLPEVRFE